MSHNYRIISLSSRMCISAWDYRFLFLWHYGNVCVCAFGGVGVYTEWLNRHRNRHRPCHHAVDNGHPLDTFISLSIWIAVWHRILCLATICSCVCVIVWATEISGSVIISCVPCAITIATLCSLNTCLRVFKRNYEFRWRRRYYGNSNLFWWRLYPSSIRRFLVCRSVRWNVCPLAYNIPYHLNAEWKRKTQKQQSASASAHRQIRARRSDTVEIAKLFMYSNGIENWRKKNECGKSVSALWAARCGPCDEWRLATEPQYECECECKYEWMKQTASFLFCSLNLAFSSIFFFFVKIVGMEVLTIIT